MMNTLEDYLSKIREACRKCADNEKTPYAREREFKEGKFTICGRINPEDAVFARDIDFILCPYKSLRLFDLTRTDGHLKYFYLCTKSEIEEVVDVRWLQNAR